MLILGSESGCLGFEIQELGNRGIAKSILHKSWPYHASWYNLSVFGVALGPIFMTLAALETAFKIGDFSGYPWATPNLEHPPDGGCVD